MGFIAEPFVPAVIAAQDRSLEVRDRHHEYAGREWRKVRRQLLYYGLLSLVYTLRHDFDCV